MEASAGLTSVALALVIFVPAGASAQMMEGSMMGGGRHGNGGIGMGMH